MLAAAASAGFAALEIRHPGSLFAQPEPAIDDALELARGAGLGLILEIDPRPFPAEHPLALSHPAAFRQHRSRADRAPIDPRRPALPSGEARARLHDAEYARLFEEPLRAALGALVDRGIAGVRIAGVDRIDPGLLRKVIAALRQSSPGLRVIGGTFDEPAEARELGSVLDAVVTSYAAWDGRAGWWFDEAEMLRAAAPILNEVRAGTRRAANCSDAALLSEAAALGDGLIVPLEMLSRGEAALDAAVDAIALAKRASSFGGAMRRVGGSAGPVGAVLRGDAPDLRQADSAALILINAAANEAPLPAPASLSSIAAPFAPFDGYDAGPPLAPGEVRVLRGERAKPVALARDRSPIEAAAPGERLVIESIAPCVEGGDFPIKRVVGDRVRVEATVFADGHEKLAAELRWRAVDEEEWRAVPMAQLENDRWHAELSLDRLGRHEFLVEAWLDRFGGFQRDFGTKVDAGVAEPVDRAEGQLLIEQAAGRAGGDLAKSLGKRLSAAEKAGEEQAARILLSGDLAQMMRAADDRPHRTRSRPHPIDAERIEARFSSWYELFPRSTSGDAERHGTFDDVIAQLPRVRAMGFDTLYFPPIHPIGRTNRKGPNNTLTPEPGDPGSPYAIGAEEGGHDAIHPELGTFEDFDRLVEAAAEHGLEIALDFAIQAAPDHPWLTEHPGWFAWRPDGTMKYAENPPKKYQDIVNLDFYGPDAVPGLWQALRDVVLLWVGHGVKTFRVDNPHTKPLPFWEWMIAEVRGQHPEVIFLSEAFTRPTMMYRLAKIGFSQSYTYFTWRDRKHELVEYITELTTEAPREFYRPHFFVNTPDINPFFLQTGGRPAHRIRAVLAATLSGLWGVYSGFELCDSTALGPGKEEYLDSEKFEIRARDWNAPGNIVADVTLLNRLRRAHPALQTHLNTRFYAAHDDNVIWYGKPAASADGGLHEMIMVMVNLDPHHPHACDFEIPLWEFGLSDQASIAVEDLARGYRFDWHGKMQQINLEPDEPYRIWRLAPQEGGA